MKHLTTRQTRDALQKETTQKMQYGLEVAQEIDKYVKKLNTIRDEYEKTKTSYENDTKKLSEEYLTKKTLLESEVATLELRRKAALKPIDDEIRIIKDQRLKLREREIELEKFEDDLQITHDTNQRCLEQATLAEKQASERLTFLAIQEENIKRLWKEFKTARDNWENKKSLDTKRITILQERNKQKEVRLSNKEKSLKVMESSLNEKRKELSIREIRLKDRERSSKCTQTE